MVRTLCETRGQALRMNDEAGGIIKKASKTRKGGGEERGKGPDSTIGGKWVDCWS